MERFVHWHILPDKIADATCIFFGVLELNMTLIKVSWPSKITYNFSNKKHIQFQIDEDNWRFAKHYKDVMELYGWIDDSLLK